jgi:hypothetical protein
MYSLICRLRTLHAMAQGTITLAFEGWTAVTPGQFVVLGCGLCLLVRILVPSPFASRGAWTRVDRTISTIAAMAIIGLAASDIAFACMLVGRLTLGL